jgi:hypothetical protein
VVKSVGVDGAEEVVVEGVDGAEVLVDGGSEVVVLVVLAEANNLSAQLEKEEAVGSGVAIGKTEWMERQRSSNFILEGNS